MPENLQGIAELVRSVLAQPNSESAIQKQMIQLARQNLHEPEMLSVLVTSLAKIRDTETQHLLLDVLMQLDTSRFRDLAGFYSALIEFFREEKERRVRAALLERVGRALQQDSRLAPFFIELIAQPDLNDEELRVATKALATLPSISEETAVLVLKQAEHAAMPVQERALALTEGCQNWGEAVLQAVRPYLNTQVDRGLRLRVLDHLRSARVLSADYAPLLTDILRNDPAAEMRKRALTLMVTLKDWSAPLLAQLFWTALHDSDAEVRAQAVRLQKESPELTNQQMQELAAQLPLEDSESVRGEILRLLRLRLSQPDVRASLLQAYSANPSAYKDEEFNLLVDLLAPYAGRDLATQEALLQSWPTLRRVEQRQKLLESVLPKLRPDVNTSWIAKLFTQERNEKVREVLFDRIKGLSVARNPELVQVFCAELLEPSSAFRLHCAQALAPSAELCPEIVPALEDVLLYDQERELVRICLDGYLQPKVARKFDVLLSVIGNEILDIASRKKCLEQCTIDGLSAEQSQALAEALSSLKSSSLRMPQ